MRLEELLQYDDIMIQCHDDPDADAIACGWTLLTYLESKGKTPRLVYTGERKVRKVNLLLMLDKFSIPLEYLPEPEGTPELLVTARRERGICRRCPAGILRSSTITRWRINARCRP